MNLLPATVFKCLGDETRARVMLLLCAQGELCVCELICALGDSQPKISRHLAQLRSCGLLETRRQGQWIYYRLNVELPQWVIEVIQVTLEANRHWLSQDEKRLDQMGERPERQAACC
jgi:ArsR family transcriptional regulator